jgi:hypothetical protein
MLKRNINIIFILFTLLFFYYCGDKDEFAVPYVKTIVPQINHHYPIIQVSMSNDNEYIATASKKEIIVSEVKSGIILHKFKLPENIIDISITNICFNKDNTELYAIGKILGEAKKIVYSLRNSALLMIKTLPEAETEICKYRWASNSLLTQINNPSSSETGFAIYSPDGKDRRLSDNFLLEPIIKAISISSDKRHIALLCSDNKIRIWDIFKPGVGSIIRFDDVNIVDEINSISFDYTKNRIYALSSKSNLFEWSTEDLSRPELINQSGIVDSIDNSESLIKAMLNNSGNTILLLTERNKANEGEKPESILQRIPLGKTNQNNKTFKILSSSPRYFSLNSEGDTTGLVYDDDPKKFFLYDSQFSLISSTETGETISSIVFGCIDELMICYENAPYLDFYTEKGKALDRINLLEKHYTKVSAFCNNIIVLSNDYGEVFLYNLYNTKDPFQLMLYNDEDFVIFTDDGYFDTSNIDTVRLIKGLDVLSENELMRYYKPDKVKNSLIELIGGVSY